MNTLNNSRELIRLAVLEVNERYIDDKFAMNSNLNETLKNKFEKVDENEEKYIELLRYNIIYYKSIIKKLEYILEMWIQNDLIQGHQSVEKSIENIKASSRQYVNKAMKNGNKHLNDKDRKIFISYDKNSGVKKIEKIENDYKILNIYKDVLGMVITVISGNVDKYKDILDMSTEEVKIDLMNEIFTMINEILFSQETPIEEFTDEALVEDDDISEEYELADEDKCISFTKYVSMISTPEISVKINDIFRDAVLAEDIEEDDAYGFSEGLKDYVSCVALLMDYISDENKQYFINTFRMMVIGLIDENEFKEVVERLVRNKTFLSKSRWTACHKLVKSDFNIENNNFFGRQVVDTSYDKIDFAQKMDLLDMGMDLPIGERVENIVDGIDHYGQEDQGGFISSLKDNLFKKKNRQDYDTASDEYYDDEFEEYNYDEINDDEDYYEKDRISDKFKNFFSKKYRGEEYSRYSNMDEDEYNDIDPNLFNGDKSIQDENALAILMMREKNRRKEVSDSKKEYDELIDERHLAEEIIKPGIKSLAGKADIVFEEGDCVYPKKGHTESLESKPVFYGDLHKEDDKYKDYEVLNENQEDTGSQEDDIENQEQGLDDQNQAGYSSDDSQSSEQKEDDFEELEMLIAMNKENSESLEGHGSQGSPDESHVKEPEEDYGEDDEYDDIDDGPGLVDRFKDSKFFAKFTKLKDAREEKKLKEEVDPGQKEGFMEVLPKAKMARDGIIIIVIIAVLFSSYIFFIKQFTMPSVEETNNTTKNVKVEKKVSGTNTSGKDNPKSTAEITQKTEAEKLRDENEARASELDRQAEQYKNGKGIYYTVFVGATKDKDGAESVANNFAKRGVQAQVVRNAGYYMLKVGEFFDYNDAYAKSKSISAKGIQNYIASQNKYYDLKISAYKIRIPNLSKDQLKTDYNDLRNQISSTGKNASYVTNLDEIYEQALKDN